MLKTFLTIFLSFLFTCSVYAHPPAEIELKFDVSASAIDVTIMHKSDDSNDHHIRKIVVYKNGQEYIVERNHQQVNPTRFLLNIPVNVKEGDELQVKAYCSEGGSRSASIIVKNEKDSQESEGK